MQYPSPSPVAVRAPLPVTIAINRSLAVSVARGSPTAHSNSIIDKSDAAHIQSSTQSSPSFVTPAKRIHSKSLLGICTPPLLNIRRILADASTPDNHKRQRVDDRIDVFVASPQQSSSSSRQSSQFQQSPALASSPTLGSSPITPASSSSGGPSSSPLASYGVNRRLAHMPVNKRPYGEYRSIAPTFQHPNSGLLRQVNQALSRLSSVCPLCWAAGSPTPGSHTFGDCPIARADDDELILMFKDFRTGVTVAAQHCFGCFLPKVCLSPFISILNPIDVVS